MKFFAYTCGKWNLPLRSLPTMMLFAAGGSLIVTPPTSPRVSVTVLLISRGCCANGPSGKKYAEKREEEIFYNGCRYLALPQ
ncbi:hypothetical protein NAF17_03170 [Mucilaginibacter sp. RB4R14]|uniref:hypothetical protein n=1 Tax=Mucilaginibacter aurantiaciroseus TaxID=2949308 RepID=UPI0020911661|nr:hypothetical protein [Mucilaginibacter aurantiaciroseus]MCO5934531.1 hypothetical protein [Mucilaginibacter aurantiaciroseus]